MFQIETLNTLQEWFSKLPGIGAKTAGRLAYYVINMPAEDVKEFAKDMYAAAFRAPLRDMRQSYG